MPRAWPAPTSPSYVGAFALNTRLAGLVLRRSQPPDNPVGALRPRVRGDRGRHRPRFAEATAPSRGQSLQDGAEDAPDDHDAEIREVALEEARTRFLVAVW